MRVYNSRAPIYPLNSANCGRAEPMTFDHVMFEISGMMACIARLVRVIRQHARIC